MPRWTIRQDAPGKPVLIVETPAGPPSGAPAQLRLFWGRTFTLPELKVALPVQPTASGFQLDIGALEQTAPDQYSFVTLFGAGSKEPIGAMTKRSLGSGIALVRRCLLERRQNDPGSGEPVATQPKLLSMPLNADDYPFYAQAVHAEGVTRLALTVSAAGRASRCDVEQSSGNEDLDQAACMLVVSRAIYTPARDGAGRPTEAKVTQPYRWKLNDMSAPPASADKDAGAAPFR
ncbi:energy transducer TonB [Sphingomonas sp. TDK1]|uniref:energy transducer TonB n=1 Tax=Sphingomonas sp. TDK1 TaxID=453247 RepID=UPI0007D9E2F7|nr:energy transducer TonB [Sphingomonas sp. TDK1]OAN58810.1 hypothetical protein A7X12_03955 [Sphingomonas sp. TDK1]